jgi:hypothetical protein
MGYTGTRKVVIHPPGPGVGQKRILMSSLIRFAPHRMINMTFNVIINLRWQRYPGNRAPCPVSTKASRDRDLMVSFFRTHQAAFKIHLHAALRRDCCIERPKDESFVTCGPFS